MGRGEGGRCDDEMQRWGCTIGPLFTQSWLLLRNNLLLLAPGLAAGLLVGLLKGFFFAPEYVVTDFLGLTDFLRRLFAFAALNVVLTLLAVAVTTSMAGRVWDEGYATIEDALQIFRLCPEGYEENNALYLSIGQILGLMVLALLLVIPTGGLSIFAAAYFLMYSVAAAVIGREPGFAAVRESISIATSRVGPTFLLLTAFCALLVLSAMIGFLFGGLWLLGPFITAVLHQLVTSYMTLVVSGEYIRSKRLSEIP